MRNKELDLTRHNVNECFLYMKKFLLEIFHIYYIKIHHYFDAIIKVGR